MLDVRNPNPNPKVISLGYAVPHFRYSQQDAFEALQYAKPYWRLFGNSGIDFRYFCMPLDKSKTLSFQEQQEQYLTNAISLSQEAIENCLDSRSVDEIGCVIYGSCTGVA